MFRAKCADNYVNGRGTRIKWDACDANETGEETSVVVAFDSKERRETDGVRRSYDLVDWDRKRQLGKGESESANERAAVPRNTARLHVVGQGNVVTPDIELSVRAGKESEGRGCD